MNKYLGTHKGRYRAARAAKKDNFQMVPMTNSDRNFKKDNLKKYNSKKRDNFQMVLLTNTDTKLTTDHGMRQKRSQERQYIFDTVSEVYMEEKDKDKDKETRPL